MKTFVSSDEIVGKTVTRVVKTPDSDETFIFFDDGSYTRVDGCFDEISLRDASRYYSHQYVAQELGLFTIEELEAERRRREGVEAAAETESRRRLYHKLKAEFEAKGTP